MNEELDDRRWLARRKFWFPSGILVDRRTGLERRTGVERRRASNASVVAQVGGDRRLTPDRRLGDRRAGERRYHQIRGSGGSSAAP